MKIQILLMGLILLSGCSNVRNYEQGRIDGLNEGLEFYEKMFNLTDPREETNQTPDMFSANPLLMNRNFATMKFRPLSIEHPTLIEKRAEEDFIRINCNNLNNLSDLPLIKTTGIIVDAWEICKLFEEVK